MNIVTQAPVIREERPAQKSFLRDLIEIILLALAIYIIIIFLVQTVHVMGQSMVPTLQDQDYLIASKISYHLHDPQRGDIVVLPAPLGPSRPRMDPRRTRTEAPRSASTWPKRRTRSSTTTASSACSITIVLAMVSERVSGRSPSPLRRQLA